VQWRDGYQTRSGRPPSAQRNDARSIADDRRSERIYDGADNTASSDDNAWYYDHTGINTDSGDGAAGNIKSEQHDSRNGGA
jgi:hypothetical protein